MTSRVSEEVPALGYKGPGLEFDERFKARPVAKQLEYLHKLVASQNDALDLMQKERNDWREKAWVLEQSVANAQKAFEIQKAIAANLITVSNETQQDAAASIHELEETVRALKG